MAARADVAPATIAEDRLADGYDAIVIGAGAGGGVAACVLAEAGHRVLLVERGELLRRADLPARPPAQRPRVDRARAPGRSAGGRATRGFVGAQAVLPTEPAWNGNAFTVGGGTRVYGAQAWRFCPEDFRMASTYGEPFADWPIGYEDLEPYDDRVEWEMGVCGPDAPRAHDGPRRRGYPMPPLPPNAAEPVLARGARALGLATGAVPLLINSVPYGGRPACVRCGTCVGFACHADAKNGTHNTTIIRAVATGRCDLLTGTAAIRLITDGTRRRRGGARVRRPSPSRCGRATSSSPRARSSPPGCSSSAAWAPRTTRSAATSRATSTPARPASSTSSCRTPSGPARRSPPRTSATTTTASWAAASS